MVCKIIAPRSKSQTMRAILLAALANGKSTINNILISPDTNAMITACRAFGAKIEHIGDKIVVDGVAGKPLFNQPTIDAGNSGQVLRFVGAIASLANQEVTFTGDSSIINNRPVSPLINAINQLNGHASALPHAPLIIRGPLKAGEIIMDGSDSQPVSGMIFASMFLDSQTKINVINPGETPWLDLTLSWLDRLNIPYENYGYTKYVLPGNAKYAGFKYNVPGDFSTIAFPLIAAIIQKKTLIITGLDFTDIQGDKYIFTILEKMGAKFIYKYNSVFVPLQNNLHGINLDLNCCIDALPILAVLACFVKGKSKFYNIKIARLKESDRIAVMSKELTKMGAKITEADDYIEITPALLKASSVNSYNDHRVAMALYVAHKDNNIDSLLAIRKSYPNFISDMSKL